MSNDNPTPSYPFPVQSDERVVTLMIYTNDLLIWGEYVAKTGLRVSTLLRSSSVPQYMYIHNANLLRFGGSGMGKPQTYKDFFLPTDQVLAYHLKPPASEPLDYDANEPMRKMSPTTILVGWFRFDGLNRMSTQTTLDRFLDVGKEPFISFYDITITNMAMSTMAAIKTPFALIRAHGVLFSSKEG